jgi:hypothetical protein
MHPKVRRRTPLLLATLLILWVDSPGLALAPPDIVGIDIAWDTGHTYAWYRDGTVSSGTSDDLSRHRTRYPYVLPPGYTPADVVGIAHATYLQNDPRPGGYNQIDAVPAVYVFYRDGKYSAGVSNNVAKYRTPYPYELPPGKRPEDIVGVSYSGREKITYKTLTDTNDMAFFAFYADGTVSAGFNAGKLDTFRKPYQYVLPAGVSPRDIVDVGVAPDTRHHFAWYRDGTVSSGVSDHLDRYRKRYSYKVP